MDSNCLPCARASRAVARHEYAKWYDSELVEYMIDGLRKAGLEIEGADRWRTRWSAEAATQKLEMESA